MKVLLHDNSGHPFQAQLSRALAARGHRIVHSHCAAYVSGKGQLRSGPGDAVRFTAIGTGRRVAKDRMARRLAQELSYGAALAALIRRERPDVVMITNTPLPTLAVAAAYLRLRRGPWVLWHQDVYAAALRSLAAQRDTPALRMIARLAESIESWCARQATQIVVIAESFRAVHTRWGTAAKMSVIPNWAPADEIVPVSRDNKWAAEHGLIGTATLLYSGTLGLKHNPSLLVSLAAEVRRLGTEISLVVVNEGPAVEVLRAEAGACGVPLVCLPFQPYDRLSEVLGSGDALVVLLEPDASNFSVPSKTLTYLCAGRPIIGLMPATNAATVLLQRAGCMVAAPLEASVAGAAAWVVDLLLAPQRAAQIGSAARDLAVTEFTLEPTVDAFEALLQVALGSVRAGAAEHREHRLPQDQ
ncbi:MAG: glycosyltransferase family 4 protein [Actinomycetota bacterium]|nr:glycosyltransferase family 4 protein [Actinomycetota bacterium]